MTILDDYISTRHPHDTRSSSSSTDSTTEASSCCKLDQLAATDVNRFWPVLIASLQMRRTDNWGQSPSNFILFIYLALEYETAEELGRVPCVRRQVGSVPPPAAQPDLQSWKLERRRRREGMLCPAAVGEGQRGVCPVAAGVIKFVSGTHSVAPVPGS